MCASIERGSASAGLRPLDFHCLRPSNSRRTSSTGTVRPAPRRPVRLPRPAVRRFVLQILPRRVVRQTLNELQSVWFYGIVRTIVPQFNRCIESASHLLDGRIDDFEIMVAGNSGEFNIRPPLAPA